MATSPAVAPPPPRDLRRAQIVLGRHHLHALLGLNSCARVVAMHVDSQGLRVEFEGPDINLAGDHSVTLMAAAGEVEPPWVWHPIHGSNGRRPSLTWGEWEPGELPAWVDCKMVDPDRPSADRAAELVFTALGQASMCWETPEGAGGFDSTQASKVGSDLLAALGYEPPAQQREPTCPTP